MRLIVGLGNPGDEYNFTRHNFGFLSLDFYTKIQHIEWQKPKLGALWARSGDAFLIKPQDFYNNSGVAIQAFAKYYKIPLENILVICDDFDLPFGQIRYRRKGSAGGNNGLKSAIDHLGSPDFPRLRLGTNNPEPRQRLGDIDFVLGHFTAAEKTALPNILTRVNAELTKFISSTTG